ncbi:hypothetical protein P153DRAFT_204701 [Dothidotthia symphoricarpi CBS 119687]|uniref:Uncharacterized protein n=1 Tax=Dothidotthia symphoricarpi CBS 119687 TaxID=1392245 RepID=A0A6A6AFU7_9PLEO|nr:uncharacterized protein P153DRAFT_204701 [Dothidotthia symphoricarpi CBS 119687]KAF2130779.1 hypothetical protein P153DRAFT_204701 [Dothidotthia symphoricarpi CBS 119687]
MSSSPTTDKTSMYPEQFWALVTRPHSQENRNAQRTKDTKELERWLNYADEEDYKPAKKTNKSISRLQTSREDVQMPCRSRVDSVQSDASAHTSSGSNADTLKEIWSRNGDESASAKGSARIEGLGFFPRFPLPSCAREEADEEWADERLKAESEARNRGVMKKVVEFFKGV